MKTTQLLSACLAVFVLLYQAESLGKDVCSVKTLRGTYTHSSQGVYAGNPYSETGMETYDGGGRVATMYTDSLNRANISDAGTYFIGGDCQGKVTYRSGAVHNIYVSPTGDGFNYILISGDGAVSGSSRRVSRQLIVK